MPRVRPTGNILPVPRLVGSHLEEMRRRDMNSGLELHVGPAPDSEFSSGTSGPPVCGEEMTPPSTHYHRAAGSAQCLTSILSADDHSHAYCSQMFLL